MLNIQVNLRCLKFIIDSCHHLRLVLADVCRAMMDVTVLRDLTCVQWPTPVRMEALAMLGGAGLDATVHSVSTCSWMPLICVCTCRTTGDIESVESVFSPYICTHIVLTPWSSDCWEFGITEAKNIDVRCRRPGEGCCLLPICVGWTAREKIQANWSSR